MGGHVKFLIQVLILLSGFSLHAKSMSCGGTEPFWNASINLDNGEVVIDSPGQGGLEKYMTKIRPTAGAPLEYAFVAQNYYVGLSVMSNPTCSDGMSDETYTHSVIVTGYFEQPLAGCCNFEN